MINKLIELLKKYEDKLNTAIVGLTSSYIVINPNNFITKLISFFIQPTQKNGNWIRTATVTISTLVVWSLVIFFEFLISTVFMRSTLKLYFCATSKQQIKKIKLKVSNDVQKEDIKALTFNIRGKPIRCMHLWLLRLTNADIKLQLSGKFLVQMVSDDIDAENIKIHESDIVISNFFRKITYGANIDIQYHFQVFPTSTEKGNVEIIPSFKSRLRWVILRVDSEKLKITILQGEV